MIDENDWDARQRLKVSRNPFIQSIFTADPSAHVFGDRLYVYPSRDIDPATGCDLMDKYHVFSTVDMVNWRDEGQILEAADVTWGRAAGGFMWAPDCNYKNGHYYFYFPHPRRDNWHVTWEIGVAISNYPAHGFQVAGFLSGLGGWAMNDPCIFIDDDGTPYLYHGGSGQCKGSILNDDMCMVKAGPFDMQGLHDYHEATFVFKRHGVYYLTYSDNATGNNHLCYATSPHALGPWTYRGWYLDGTGCETSHGSVVEFRGQWYAFYHSDALSHAGNLRSICVDPLYFNADGAIQPVVQSRGGRLPLPYSTSATPPSQHVYAASEAVITQGQKAVDASTLKHEYVTFDATTTVSFNNVTGGVVSISIYYGTLTQLAKCKLFVNSKFETRLNLPYTGSDHHLTGVAHYTLTLPADQANRLMLVGDVGVFSIEAISTSIIRD